MKLLSERHSAPSPPRSTPLSFSSLYYLSEKTPALLPRAIFTQHARHINWKPESSAAPKGTPPYLDYGLHPVVSTLRPTLVTSAPTLYHHNTVLFIPCMCFTPPNTPPLQSSLSRVVQSFILVFAVPWENSLHISAEPGRCLPSLCNSITDKLGCAHHSPSTPPFCSLHAKPPVLTQVHLNILSKKRRFTKTRHAMNKREIEISVLIETSSSG